MPYAANGRISQSPIEGGVEISVSQYKEAMDGMLRGELVSIDGGFNVAPPPEPEPEPEPEPPTLEEAKTAKLQELKHAADAEVAPILAEYPEVEIKTWDSQEREARAWTADNNAATPTLSGIEKTRGKSISYLAPKVIEKADQYRALAASVSGKRQALAEAVEAATTVAEVEQITWES